MTVQRDSHLIGFIEREKSAATRHVAQKNVPISMPLNERQLWYEKNGRLFMFIKSLMIIYLFRTY